MRFNIITDFGDNFSFDADLIKVDDYQLYYKYQGDRSWNTLPIGNVKMISIRDHQNQHPAGI